MTAPTAYPLSWPAGRPRTPLGLRKRAAFGFTSWSTGNKEQLSVAKGIDRVLRELRTFDARYPLISSGVELRRDGLPRSDRREPADPGVAVYFTQGGKPYCLACDTYDRVADNLAAIAGHVEATRRQLRYGVATAEESLRAFEALPAPTTERPWREVLELRNGTSVDRNAVMAAYRRLALERHPDHGGSDAMMADLNVARDRALAELGASSS